MEKAVIVIENRQFKVALVGTPEETKNFIIDYKKNGVGQFFERINADNLSTYKVSAVPSRFDVDFDSVINIHKSI